MGLGGISITSLILILVVVILVFGTRKLRNAGSDVGGAVKNFRQALKDETPESQNEKTSENGDKQQKVAEDSQQK